MGQLQWTPVAASWHLLSQPPLFTAHVSAWEGERKAAVRDCVQKTEGVMPPRCPPCHRLGVAESTNLPVEPVEAALGSHTTARRPQSREIMNTWGWCPPQTGPLFGRPPLAAPKRRNSISQGQSHSTCAKAARHRPGVPRDVGAQPQSPSGVARESCPPCCHQATESQSHMGDPVPSVPDCHPLLRHGGCSSVSG